MAVGATSSTMANASSASSTASSSGCSGKFVYQKLNVVRWRPREEDGASGTALGNSRSFVTGSWEDESNSICLWHLPESGGRGGEPVLTGRVAHHGDVNQIRFLNDDTLVSSSSDGSVRLFNLVRGPSSHTAKDSNDSVGIVQRQEWNHLHHGSCNGLDTLPSERALVSAGEDGRVFVMTLTDKTPLRTYEKADSCSITAALYVKRDEVCVTNMRGQLKVFDLRSREEAPSATYMSSEGEQVGISCLCRHPTQSHIVCTGSQDGRLTFWDLRRDRLPISIFKGHEHSVAEVRFHPQQPEHFFSCSEGGDVWHWNGVAATAAAATSGGTNFGNQFGSRDHQHAATSSSSSSSNWFSNEAIKHRVETSALLPSQSLAVNSLDVAGRDVVVGGDNEAVYVINGVFL